MSPPTMLSCLLLIAMASSTTYYVNPSNSITNGDGKSWNNAFTTLNDALSAAFQYGSIIWLIGDATYYSNSNDRSNCFSASRGIEIYGGFVGNELLITDRPSDTSLYPSIISGDINILNDNTDNCYHVLFYNQKLLLDRVIISDGYADYEDYSDQNNILNRYGGGLMQTSGSPNAELYFYDTIFINNTAINGGALWFSSTNMHNVDIIIRDCKFENNKAINGLYDGGYGGAIYLYFLANITVFNTQFINNYGLYRGGAIYQDYGGIFYCNQCTFNNNKAAYGAAIFSEDRNSQTSGTFPKIISSTFNNNNANIYGGALCMFNGVIATLTNNQFTSNTADNSGGAIALINSELSVDSGNTYSGNIAIINGNDIYNEPDFEYNSIDDTLSFDIASELTDLYNTYTTIYPQTDLYTFSVSDALCYVDIDNSSPTNGLSWNNAYNDLQQCLNQLSTTGGEIWVKYGTYIPSSAPDWKVKLGKTISIHYSFSMYDNVRMYGGFDGSETSRDERDFVTNPTYLSCDLVSPPNGFCNEILQAADGAIIDGFIFIDAGYGIARRRLANSIDIQTVLSSTSDKVGSGIFSNSTTISVVNSIFYKLLSTGKGGAVYCIGLQGETQTKSPTFINVKFLGNRAAIRGGAIAADVECDFICKYCTFDSNSCSKKGGAVYLDFDCDPTFENTIFRNNYALESGGCIAGDGKSNATFIGTAQFNNNSALWEGGCLYSGSGAGQNIVQGFIFEDNMPIFNDNYLINNGMGQNDIYLWPYSTVNFPDIITTVPTTHTPTTSAPTTAAPTTAAPTTTAPTTAAPTTTSPTTSAPTTSEPTTAIPTTANPTAVPTTSIPTTTSPTPLIPTTAVPTSSSPSTSIPTTSSPTTLSPTTLSPTTSEPTSNSPTLFPTTSSPTTPTAPTTPTTASPTTNSPTTNAPTTNAPTTNAPTTNSPTTYRPTTSLPTTYSATTHEPSTNSPTLYPTTSSPTTLYPTTNSATLSMSITNTAIKWFDTEVSADEISIFDPSTYNVLYWIIFGSIILFLMVIICSVCICCYKKYKQSKTLSRNDKYVTENVILFGEGKEKTNTGSNAFTAAVANIGLSKLNKMSVDKDGNNNTKHVAIESNDDFTDNVDE